MTRQSLIAVALAASLASCVSTGTKVTEDQITQFQKGKTTEAEIIAKLGKPNTTGLNSDGLRVDNYTYMRASADAVDFVPVVGLLAGGATSQVTTVTFTFDKTGVLTTYTTVSGTQDVHTGLLNQ